MSHAHARVPIRACVHIVFGCDTLRDSARVRACMRACVFGIGLLSFYCLKGIVGEFHGFVNMMSGGKNVSNQPFHVLDVKYHNLCRAC